MIVVDTSAIIAIIDREPGYEKIAARLFSASPKFVPASVLVEAIMVLARSKDDPETALTNWLDIAGLAVVPIDEGVVEHAQAAFLRFGKGRHKAALNFGDCFAYGVAKALNQPLLFVGNDFVQTDIQAA